jgi:hypothetical protein
MNSYPEANPTGGTCCRLENTPGFNHHDSSPVNMKGYLIQFFNISDVLTVDNPANVVSAFKVAGKRQMELFKGSSSD